MLRARKGVFETAIAIGLAWLCYLETSRWLASPLPIPTSINLNNAQGSWAGLRTAVAEFAPYHEGPPYRFSFADVFDSSSIGSIESPDGALQRLREKQLDVIVITSGDKRWLTDTATRALVDAKDTMVVLIIHHAYDLRTERQQLQEIAAEGRLCMLGLSPHTTTTIRSTLGNWSITDNQIGWDKTLVDSFIPIFPIPANEERKGESAMARIAIQGNIEYKRRDYKRIIADLQRAIELEPAAWGYAPDSIGTGGPFRPLNASTSFSLHLMGEHKSGVKWPVEMKEVIHVHGGLKYSDYYSLLSTMDLVVPAFADGGYFVEKASSSIAAAVLAKVPVLVTPTHVRSYTYLENPAIRLHPGGMSAVEALRRIRLKEELWLPVYEAPDLRHSQLSGPSADHALNAHDWEKNHQKIYAANERVLERIAKKMRGGQGSFRDISNPTLGSTLAGSHIL